MEFYVNQPILFLPAGISVAVVLARWVFFLVPALKEGTLGIMVPLSALFTILVGRVLYRKGVL